MHFDARWLTEACAGKDVTTKEDAKRVFSALGQNDARALCFMWLLDEVDEIWLRCAAQLSSVTLLLKHWMARETEGEEKFIFAQLAAAQGERDGLYVLGLLLSYHGEGCEKDLDKAKENFLLCERTWSCFGRWLRLGDLLDESDPAAMALVGPGGSSLDFSWNFLSSFPEASRIVQLWLWKCCCHVCNRTELCKDM
jgi:hypothetical protein